MNPAAHIAALLWFGVAALEGKVRSDRAILLEATVDAPPAQVLRLWTTEGGARKFFAPAAGIDAGVGGRDEMIFDPENDPEGAAAGTQDAWILRLDSGRAIAFEWSVGVPDVSFDLKSADFQTWVEVSLEPVPGTGKTHGLLAHKGFGHGGSWDAAFGHFEMAWRLVVDRLATYRKEGKIPW